MPQVDSSNIIDLTLDDDDDSITEIPQHHQAEPVIKEELIEETAQDNALEITDVQPSPTSGQDQSVQHDQLLEFEATGKLKDAVDISEDANPPFSEEVLEAHLREYMQNTASNAQQDVTNGTEQSPTSDEEDVQATAAFGQLKLQYEAKKKFGKNTDADDIEYIRE